MAGKSALLLALTWALPTSAAAAGAQHGHAFVEREDPDFEKAPNEQDLAAMVYHLGDLITDNRLPENLVPGIDFFIGSLEQHLHHQGTDLPRDRIVRNAAAAREDLRLAFNVLADAGSPPHLAAVRDALREAAAELRPLVEHQRAALASLRAVAAAAQANAGAISVSPPASSGGEVPVDGLHDLRPLAEHLGPLQEKLYEIAANLQAAQQRIDEARRHSVHINGLAQRAGHLDREALHHLGQRRTRGKAVEYRTQMNSQRVIANANAWLLKAVGGADKVAALMARQLSPEHPGLRRAVDRMIEADLIIQRAKETQRRAGRRINFNHKERLNKWIRRGWEVAAGPRRNWWVGRAQMARAESAEDARKAEQAYLEAVAAIEKMGAAADAGLSAVEEIERDLGAFAGKPPRLARRALDVPEIEEPDARTAVYKGGKNHPKSKGLKVPRSFDIPLRELTSEQTFYGRQ